MQMPDPDNPFPTAGGGGLYPEINSGADQPDHPSNNPLGPPMQQGQMAPPSPAVAALMQQVMRANHSAGHRNKRR